MVSKLLLNLVKLNLFVRLARSNVNYLIIVRLARTVGFRCHY